MNKLRLLTTSAFFVGGTLGAQAGGFELSPLSTAFMYENGAYAEVSYSSRDYSITDGSVYAPTGSALKDQKNATFAFKSDLSDALSLGLTKYRQGSVQLDYSGAGSSLASALPVVDMDIDALVALARYELNENFSVLAGLKQTTVQDSFGKNIFTNQTNITGDSEVGHVYGLTYERDDIALRVELTHEKATNFKLESVNGSLSGKTTASVPDYLNFAFQTGVAKDTLLFGSIRKANWASNQITLFPQPSGTTSTYKDSTTYNIGLGRKINDQFSILASYKTEKAGDPNQASLLNTTNGYDSLGVGVVYSLENATITFGANYTKVGDVNMTPATTPASVFSGNTVKSLGLKIGYNF